MNSMSGAIKVAVFPCGSEVGLEIHRALKYYRHFHLIGLSSVNDYGRIVYEDYVGNVPFINRENFIFELRKIIKKNKVRFLIPAMDEVGYLLKKHEKTIGCEVVYPEMEIAEILRKKSSTYDALRNIIKTPKVFKGINEEVKEYPLFIKPDIGYGSRGAKRIDSKADLQYVSGELDEYILMENLPGSEYTIDCFSNSSGKLLFSGARVRNRIRMGISVSTKTVKNQEPFLEIATKISETLKLKGLWFFQLKEDKDGDLTLLEIAGRVSGSMSLFRGLGINFIASDLFQRAGALIKLPKLIHKTALLERSFDCKIEIEIDFDTVYCDLDDCLIIGNRVNQDLVAFLFQCINKGKKLVLITRHATNPGETLKKFRLSELFIETIHIKDKNVSKATKIKTKDAIFIDDSFSERSSVSESCGIPTFAPDAIELLIIK